MKIALLSFLLLFVHATFARELVVISDLDETLRMANVEKKFKAGLKLIEGVRPYEGLAKIFNEIKAKNPEAKFYYLSNSFTFLYDGESWLKRHDLPQGVVMQRCLMDKSDSFKPEKLKEIGVAHPEAKFILFGDNIEKDPEFYREFLDEFKPMESEVYIRDARLLFPEVADMTYYQHEAQITDDLEISPETTAAVKALPFKQLVPKFLLKNLQKRLIKSCVEGLNHCRAQARYRVQEIVSLLQVPETELIAEQ